VAALVKAFLHKCNADAGSSDEEEDDGVDLCNCEFSLAYGGLPLFVFAVCSTYKPDFIHASWDLRRKM